jgi:hypothetical protein
MTSQESTPEGLDPLYRTEIAKWRKVIRDADIPAVE